MRNDRNELLDRFHEAMLGLYDAACRLNPPYRPTAFRSMVNSRGGKQAADDLLAAGDPARGFTELYLRGVENLRLSVEYLVLQEPWRELFEAAQLETARNRLREVGCEPPPEDDENQAHGFRLPDEVKESDIFTEGAVRSISVNTYERNPEARARCISHYGAQCYVCGFAFETTYGPSAKGYIHVHHLVPISEIGERYEVDPVRDLRPVCPNCHAVIHMNGETRAVEEVRALIEENRLDERKQTSGH